MHLFILILENIPSRVNCHFCYFAIQDRANSLSLSSKILMSECVFYFKCIQYLSSHAYACLKISTFIWLKILC